MRIAIIDYGSGNLHSAQKAFERASRELNRADEVSLTANPDYIIAADYIVLPGVGTFADCKSGLEAVPGVIDALTEAVVQKGRPFLGICVGLQLLANTGRENGSHQGLGWIKGEVVAIEPDDPNLKIPHMGWNTLTPTRDHPLLQKLKLGTEGQHAYFVHSYHFKPTLSESIIATTQYGGPVVAIVGRDNIVGTQFHPEKSQKLGLSMISNFLGWRP